MTEAFDEIMQNRWLSYDYENEEHLQILRDAAAKTEDQHPIFWSKPRKEPKTLFHKRRCAVQPDEQQLRRDREQHIAGYMAILTGGRGSGLGGIFAQRGHLLDTTSHQVGTCLGEDSSTTDEEIPVLGTVRIARC